MTEHSSGVTGEVPNGWELHFAWWPVWVDAYDPSEIKNGKMRYRKWLCWVERKFEIRPESEFGDAWQGWKYRPDRKIFP